MRTIGIGLVSLALCACQPTRADKTTDPETAAVAPILAAVAPVQYFYFGNHVPRAVITAIEGVDTASARLVGHVTAADNHAYCIDMTGGAGSSRPLLSARPKTRTSPTKS